MVADAGATMRPRWWDWVSLMVLSITSFPVSLVRGGPRRGVVGFTPITLLHYLLRDRIRDAMTLMQM
jgi:hypothetical protein